ncbi:hypothetical protein GCM10018953_70320 [Streptosporangium nondiastaticum]
MSVWMSSTTPMPSIDMGIRPTKPAMTNPLAPGMPNNPRYSPATLGTPPRFSGVDRTEDFSATRPEESHFPDRVPLPASWN